jgi:hypothetical protein
MSVSEEWGEFMTPEAIFRNTGVWPIGSPKPRLRWRDTPFGYWEVGVGHVKTVGVDRHLWHRVTESALLRFALNPDVTRSWDDSELEPIR